MELILKAMAWGFSESRPSSKMRSVADYCLPSTSGPSAVSRGDRRDVRASP